MVFSYTKGSVRWDGKEIKKKKISGNADDTRRLRVFIIRQLFDLFFCNAFWQESPETRLTRYTQIRYSELGILPGGCYVINGTGGPRAARSDARHRRRKQRRTILCETIE